MNAAKDNLSNSSNKEVPSTGLRYKRLQEYSSEIDWAKLVNLIVHHYVESGIGKLQVPVETMIRVYFLQQRYKLSSQEAALALSKVDVLREFAIIDLKTDVLPEEESIDSFRSLIDLNELANQFAEEFNIQPLQQKTLSLKNNF